MSISKSYCLFAANFLGSKLKIFCDIWKICFCLFTASLFMFPTSRYFNILGNNFVKIGIILKIFCDNMKYFLSICCQVFQVLHLTLCPTSPPPARQNQLNSPKNKKRKTTHEKGLNSHQLLIVWKVSRGLT